MKKLLLLLLTITTFAFAQDKDIYVHWQENEIDAKDPCVGFFKANDCYAKVNRLENKNYTLWFVKDIFKAEKPFAVAKNLSLKDGKIDFDITEGDNKLKGSISADKIDATGSVDGKNVKLALTKFDYVSPTMGQKAPKNSIVLFDESAPDKHWKMKNNKLKFNWVVKNNTLTVPKRLDKKWQDIVSKENYGNSKMHVEFLVPAQYDVKYANRGNSGVFFGPYEVQVYDSFMEDCTDLSCGAIYKNKAPSVNATLEPGAWQTYDITFTKAVFDGDKLVKKPLITVYQNGVLIHDNLVIEGTSGVGKARLNFKHPQGDLRLELQDHLSPVSYRNVWIEKLD